MLGQISVTKNI